VLLYSIGTKNRDLKYNPDGLLTLYVQNSEPKDKKANWLPCTKGIFRCYGPQEIIIKNDWTPPAVIKT